MSSAAGTAAVTGEGLDARCQDDGVVGLDGDRELFGRIQGRAAARHVPFNVTLELTLNCNIRCLHCYNLDRDQPRTAACSGAAAAPEREPELTLPEILTLLGDLRDAGCLILGLT